MKNFLVTYHSPKEVIEQLANVSPEDMAKGQQPWLDWKAKHANKVIDLGAPLVSSQNLGTEKQWKVSDKGISGYSILKAKNLEEAKAVLNGHPHLSWAQGCSLEVHETIEL